MLRDQRDMISEPRYYNNTINNNNNNNNNYNYIDNINNNTLVHFLHSSSSSFSSTSNNRRGEDHVNNNNSYNDNQSLTQNVWQMILPTTPTTTTRRPLPDMSTSNNHNNYLIHRFPLTGAAEGVGDEGGGGGVLDGGGLEEYQGVLASTTEDDNHAMMAMLSEADGGAAGVGGSFLFNGTSSLAGSFNSTLFYGGAPGNNYYYNNASTDPIMSGDSNSGNGEDGAYIPESLTHINMTQLIAYSLLFPFAAVGNLMVFVALFRNRHRKSRVNMMIMHLSLADMIVTFVFLPTEITWHVTIEWVFGNFGCKVYKFFSAFGFYMSSMVLVCISLDRYFAVLHPLKVNDAQRRGKIMLFFAWLISAVISLPQSVIFNVQPHPEYPDFYQCVTFGFFNSNDGGEMMYTVFCISFLYFIPLSIIIIAYTRIIVEISRKSKDTQQDYTRGERYHGRLQLRRSNMSNIERARTRTLRMTFIIVMAFIWCWTPYALATLWNFIDPETFYSMNKHLQDILFIIAVSNSVVNPIIYGRYSISCCRGLWNRLCYCRCCCGCGGGASGHHHHHLHHHHLHHHHRLASVPPPCKSNGHCPGSGTRSTIYNNSTRERRAVGAMLQMKVRSLLLEWNRSSQRSLVPEVAELASMVPLSNNHAATPYTMTVHNTHPQQQQRSPSTPSRSTTPAHSRPHHYLHHHHHHHHQHQRPPMSVHQEEENDGSSGYSSCHAHSFRSCHDLTFPERSVPGSVAKNHVWENHHSC